MVIGGGRDLRQRVDYGPTVNRCIHQMGAGQAGGIVTPKAERLGMCMVPG